MTPIPATLVLPAWLVYGLLLGAVLSVLIGLLFYVGQRRYGDSPRHADARGASTGHASVDGDGAGRRAGPVGGVRGDERRRREIRRYLEAIGEPYEEDAQVAGTSVAFHLPEREVAVTFDARAFFRIQEAGGTAVLSEHELPGAHIGSRLPFETPTFGRREAADSPHWRGSRPDRELDGRRAQGAERARRVRAAFAALGLPPDADAEAVETAYRRRIKDVHPDHGGDRSQFARVRSAYDVAIDSVADADVATDGAG